MSGTIMTTLFCWVIGTPTKQIFPVEIEPDKLWGHVKDAIKEKKKPEFDDIAADTFDLWKVRHCATSHVVAQFPIQKVTIGRSKLSLLESENFLKSVTTKNPLHSIDSLSTKFNDPVPDNPINIIIVRWPARELLKMS
jgi:hypothetical protein